MNTDTIYHGNALDILNTLVDSDSIDCIVTDPPYALVSGSYKEGKHRGGFMGKDWDKAVVSVSIWKECLRVLKPGAFAFIMSSPRQDVLSRMICNLQDAGFETNFSSIYWTYASGFPKAADVSKLVDKRNGRTQDTYKPFADYLKQKRIHKGLSMNQIDEILGTNTAYSWWEGRLSGIQLPSKFYYLKLKKILDLDDRFDDLIEREEAEREIIAQKNKARSEGQSYALPTTGKTVKYIDINITKPATDKAKELEGAYAGFQPKPALEIILCVMKPLSEKSYVDQALANGKGCTWLDNCRIPYQSEQDYQIYKDKIGGTPWSTQNSNEGWKREAHKEYTRDQEPPQKGRFPANLLCQDDVLNDGKITKSVRSHRGTMADIRGNNYGRAKQQIEGVVGGYNDSGSYSRYFSLDKWFETTFPFIITPKPSKKEKNMGLIDSYFETSQPVRFASTDKSGDMFPTKEVGSHIVKGNFHPTCKPIKLMSYLIMLGSRKDDIILDPFAGSGTTLIAAKMLERRYIGIDLNEEYCNIAKARLSSLIETIHQSRLIVE